MALVLSKEGQADTAPDLKAWAEDLSLASLALIVHVLHYVIEHQDSEVVLQLYMHTANRFNDLDPGTRHNAAGEGQDRYFTREALERMQDDIHEARKIISGAAGELDEGTGIKLIM